MRRCWLTVLFAVGCYHPTLQLDVPCSAEGECPGGQVCVNDRCVAEGTQVIDGAVQLDAPIEDNTLDAAIDGPIDGPGTTPAIMFKGERDTEIPSAVPVTAVVVATPTCSTGSLLLGVIAVGVSGETVNPTITAPNGWTLVRRQDHPFDLALAVYTHVAGNNEPAERTWTLSNISEGAAWIACYANVDTSDPIVDDNGTISASAGPSYPFPSVNPDVPNTMLVGIVAGHGGSMASWTPPAGTTERLDVHDGTSRSATMADRLFPGTGPTAMLTETASVAQDFAVLEVIALRPKL